MTLSADDRERVEELVAALEEAGADVWQVRAEHDYPEDPIEFRVRGEIRA